ncbi:Protein-er retention protein [Mycena indigotica]|uniref:Protein-er retention protein n=1 Tax=Mycena indigotica TaxID=2126181 RepID=A0A8H6TDX9_9AGAR|nr:Protein-er retention protein [Mycena indigotica]KAF7315514.1 Protein-er retention protein [Mycena indigotica]
MSEIPVIVDFPLPFRVLVLAGLGIVGWATNLHGLDLLGVDAVSAMDLRVEANLNSHLPAHLTTGPKPPSHPSVIYHAVYRLFAAYAVWCFLCWGVFRYLTWGDMALVDAFGYIPAIAALVVLMALVSPIDILYKRERDKFLQSIRRCLFSSMDAPIYFADVVFADVFTSFAKVLGDVWLSARMLLPGSTLFRTPDDGPWSRWIMPTIMRRVSLPYLVRFKQCLVEYSLPSNDSRRPLFNALKYATSFPVIYLSAAQRLVMKEKGDGEAWHGQHPLFRLWLLAAVVNSLYSFWWDVTNDWGLSLLRPHDTSREKPPPPRPLLLAHRSTASEEHMTPATNHQRQPYPFGLRSPLLFPLPVYPLVVFLNLVLRMTWSIKLSSHLHSKSEGSVTIFWLEMAELLRRWLWVFVRVEWEVIKRAQLGPRRDVLLEDFSGDEGEDYEMVPRTADETRV